MNKGIYIGNDKMGNKMFIPTNDPLRIGILAASGSGKTVLLSNIVLMLAREFRHKIQFVGLDPKLVSLHSMEKRFSVPSITQPTQFLPTLNKLEQVMNDRLAAMHVRNWVKIDPYLHGDEFPQIVIIVEELPSFVGHPDLSPAEQKTLKSFFDTYLTRCRAANMGMIVCSHTYSATDSINTLARSQFNTRFIGKCGVTEAHLFDEGQDDKCNVLRLGTTGEFFMAIEGNFNEWTRMKTWYTPEDQVQQLATQHSLDNRDIGLGWTVSNPFEQ